ncbi:unnamed protein product [Symbiodinium sp. CCMP2592]|nr:unnamed protein product [Symbiodinium sp. CCMP2592]
MFFAPTEGDFFPDMLECHYGRRIRPWCQGPGLIGNLDANGLSVPFRGPAALGAPVQPWPWLCRGRSPVFALREVGESRGTWRNTTAALMHFFAAAAACAKPNSCEFVSRLNAAAFVWPDSPEPIVEASGAERSWRRVGPGA